jgi:hypothetical protein
MQLAVSVAVAERGSNGAQRRRVLGVVAVLNAALQIAPGGVLALPLDSAGQQRRGGERGTPGAPPHLQCSHPPICWRFSRMCRAHARP